MSRELRYLSRTDVRRCLPPIGGQIDLAEDALLDLTRDSAEVPVLVGVHPREESFLHAMPAWDKTSDIVGVKWVSHYPANPLRGLPAVSGLVVINDAQTGVPLCIMDGTEITARRTAAVSGAAVRLFDPGPRARAPRTTDAAPADVTSQQRPTHNVGFIGAGNQARMHLEMLIEALGQVHVRAFDAVKSRAETFVEEVAGSRSVASAAVADSAGDACDGADILVSVASSRALGEKVVTPDMMTAHCLILVVDWAIMLEAAVAQDAGLLLVDDLAQYTRACEASDHEWFGGFPRAHGSLGRALLAAERLAAADEAGGRRTEAAGTAVSPASVSTGRDAVAAALGGHADGRILIAGLGVAAVDIVTAGAVHRVALTEHVGLMLPV